MSLSTPTAPTALRRWRDLTPFSKDGLFPRRLAADGINERDLRRLLGEAVDAVRDRTTAAPAWLRTLDRALDRPPSGAPVRSAEGNPHSLAGFVEVIEPLISQGARQVARGDRGPGSRARPTAIRSGRDRAGAGARSTRTPASHDFRHVDTGAPCVRLQGDLCGDSSEDRFGSFIELMCRRDRVNGFFREYPVLARQLVERIDQWVAFNLEFLRNLCTDMHVIRESFSRGSDPGIMTAVAGGQGDSHCGGRSVRIAEFGSGLRVVYKPRNLAVDLHFQELLTWLNERGDHPVFRTLTIVDRGSYGWVEFVAEEDCTSLHEVRRFYQRQGGYLALLHALDATDFHCENLIAAGEHPVLIDLEALFQPRIELGSPERVGRLADEALSQSVMRVGLLPHRIWGDEEFDGVDLSGLGSDAGQLSPRPVPFWENAGTDAMQIARKRVATVGARNRPKLDGLIPSALDHAGDIEAGFAEIYQLIESHRDSLLSNGGFLARFASDEIRVILRPTNAYWTMFARASTRTSCATPWSGTDFSITSGSTALSKPTCSGRFVPSVTTCSGAISRWSGRSQGPLTSGATTESGLPIISPSHRWRRSIAGCVRWAIQTSAASAGSSARCSRRSPEVMKGRPRRAPALLTGRSESGVAKMAFSQPPARSATIWNPSPCGIETRSPGSDLLRLTARITGRYRPLGSTSTTGTRACCSFSPIWAQDGRSPLHVAGRVRRSRRFGGWSIATGSLSRRSGMPMGGAG